MKKKNNVYGIIGIGVKNANYNAGFDKYPKRTAEGELYDKNSVVKRRRINTI